MKKIIETDSMYEFRTQVQSFFHAYRSLHWACEGTLKLIKKLNTTKRKDHRAKLIAKIHRYLESLAWDFDGTFSGTNEEELQNLSEMAVAAIGAPKRKQ